MTWTTMTPPGEMPLEGQFWWNDQHGYLAGWFTAVETTDGGASWFRKHGPFGQSPIYQEEALHLDSSHRLVITFLEGAQIWETGDDGESWTELYQRNRTGGYADIDRLEDGTLLTCSSFGDLLRSTDMGQTWANFTHCPEDQDRSHVEALGASPGGLAFAGGREFLWLRSTDHGRTWDIPEAAPEIRTARSIVFRDDLLALAAGYLPSEPSQVNRTTDGGASWTVHELTGSYVGYPDEIVIPGPTTCYVVTSGGAGDNRVFRSTDKGETWEERILGLPTDVDLDSIFFLDEEIGFVGGGHTSDPVGIWKTTDGGAQWTALPETGLGQSSIHAMHWTDENTGVVAGFAGIHRTTDGGQNWSQTLDERFLSMAFQDDQIGIASSYFDQGVWLTEDGGVSWELLDYPWAHAPDDVTATSEGFLVGGMGSVILSLRPSGAATPTPVPTGTPEPTQTPEPTITPEPTATPDEITIRIHLNQLSFTAGDPFELAVSAFNPGPNRPLDQYVILDVSESYYFWPSWGQDLDHQRIELATGPTAPVTILAFDWPAGVGAAAGLRFWAAFLEPATMTLVGDYDVTVWEYS